MDTKKDILPGHETQTTEMNCPSCGRFVGAKMKCPYCGASMEKRMSLRVIRYAAVLLATIGLVLLYLMAKHSDIPTIKIDDISPTMNFGQVKIAGEVVRDAQVYSSGTGGFRVSDGTGEIMVFLSAKQVEQLRTLGLFPRAGDQIIVTGALSYSEDRGASLRLQNAEGVELQKKPAPALPLGDLSLKLKGTPVTVEGKVLDVIPPAAGSKQPYSLKLEDASASKTIVFWQDDYDQIKDKDILNGSFIRARVSVSDYKGELQIKLSGGDSVEVIPALGKAPSSMKATASKTVTSAKPAKSEQATVSSTKKKEAFSRDLSRGRRTVEPNSLSVKEVTPELEGKTIRVRGRVESIRAPEPNTKQPFSVILRDGDATLRVTYWSNVDEVIAVKPTPGVVFEMEGEVEVYQEKPQLKVKSGYTVKMVDDLPASQPVVDTSKAVTIQSITLADLGQPKIVVGSLGADQALKGGVSYPISDATGTISLILWEGKTPAEIRDRLQEGVQVAASAKVNEYKGNLNLVAEPGYSVMVIN